MDEGRKELKRQLLEVADLLYPKYKEIFILKLGLHEKYKLSTYEEIGQLYGATRQRVGRIYDKAIREIIRLYENGKRKPDYAYFYLLGFYKNPSIFIDV